MDITQILRLILFLFFVQLTNKIHTKKCPSTKFLFNLFNEIKNVLSAALFIMKLKVIN